MPDFETIRAFIQQTSSVGSRSTALAPLTLFAATLVPGVLFYHYWEAPNWVGVFFAVVLSVVVIVFLVTFTYFAKTDPSLLRSEKYNLTAMAIEKNLIGDNREGLKVVPASDSQKVTQLPGETNKIAPANSKQVVEE